MLDIMRIMAPGWRSCLLRVWTNGRAWETVGAKTINTMYSEWLRDPVSRSFLA